MKKRNKIIIGCGALLLVLILAGYGISVACGPWNGPGRCFGPGFHDDFGQFLLWRLDRKAEKLQLKKEQRDKYNEIRAKIEEQFSAGREDHKRMREEFYQEFQKEDPDLKLMAKAVKEKIARISGFMNENIDLFMELYEILDNDQKEMVLEMIRERDQCSHR